MTLSKQWFDDEIARWTAHKKTCVHPSDIFQASGIIAGLKIAYTELVKPPQKTEAKKKDIDVDKGYENIVKYYVDKKGYSVERANEIAQKAMTDQQQTRL